MLPPIFRPSRPPLLLISPFPQPLYPLSFQKSVFFQSRTRLMLYINQSAGHWSVAGNSSFRGYRKIGPVFPKVRMSHDQCPASGSAAITTRKIRNSEELAFIHKTGDKLSFQIRGYSLEGVLLFMIISMNKLMLTRSNFFFTIS